jgi:hypothetical protein
LGGRVRWTGPQGNIPPAGQIVEISSLTRTTGASEFPHDVLCFQRIIQFPIRPSNEDLVVLLQRDRECAEFTTWHQGFTPKEHREISDRERLREWQAQREDEDRRWREDQRKEERRWRLIELVVLGGFVTIVLVIAQLVAAFIQR